MRPKTKTALKLICLFFAAVILLLVCIKLFPLVLSLKDAEVREEFKGFIDELGFVGAVIMVLLQIAQIVVAIIPGEPVEILFGMMYGTVGGLLLSLLGVAIGETAVFMLVKRFGVSFAARFVNVKKFEELKFLKDARRRDSLIFLLFFIPGTPKDVLTYFAPFTGIDYLRFILLSTFARIPSVVSSTFAGASLSEGAFIKTVIIFAVTGVVGLLGIFINDRISKAQNKQKGNRNP